MNFFKKSLLFTFFYFISLSASSKNQSVYFQPNIVELNGEVKVLKFPGPPNYESIKNGDADETGAYLVLDQPIDIALVPNIQIGSDEPTKNVKFIQLIVSGHHDWKWIKEGNYVQITGTLFSALTGHHHARSFTSS